MPQSPVPIQDLGKAGVVKDAPRVLLPPNTFTDVLNVRFRNNCIETTQGEAFHFNVAGLNPYYGLHWPRTENPQTIFTDNLGKFIRRLASGTENVMLDDPLLGGGKIQGDYFGGGLSVFFNNGRTTPVYCLEGAVGGADTTLLPFPGWNYGGVTYTAKVIRPIGYSLVAANLVLAAGGVTTLAPTTVRISNQAAIGNFPQTWEPTLTSDTADQFELNAKSPIQDMMELRGNMMIYTSTSIHTLALSNGIASVRGYSKDHGCLNLGCVIEFGNQHFVVDRFDIYVHNGSGQFQSVAEGRMRDFFLNDCDFSLSERVFVHHDLVFRELWVCYRDKVNPDAYEGCNKALIYDYVSNTFTIRQLLPRYTHLMGSPAQSIGTVSADPQMIKDSEAYWGLNSTPTVFLMNSGWKFFKRETLEFEKIKTLLERKGLSIDGNPFGHTTLQGLVPLFESLDEVGYPEGEPVISFTVIGTNNYSQNVDWSNADGRALFTIKPLDDHSGYVIHPRKNGRFLNYRVEADTPWRLSMMMMDAKPEQRR